MGTDRFLRFGVFYAPYFSLKGNPTLQLRRGIAIAEHLDELGFDEVWYGEHHSQGVETIGDPSVYIAAAAEHTERLMFGTGVTTLPYYHPFLVADRIVQLDHQTRGRIILGTGPGKTALDSHMLGLDMSQQRRMQGEALEAIMPLLRGEAVTKQTDWYVLRDGRLQLRPYRPEGIEVVTASTVSPSGSVLAGTHGTSLLSLAAGSPEGFEALDKNWNVYETVAAQHGHAANRANWRLVSPMFIAETREEARRMLSRRVQFVGEYLEKCTGLSFDWTATPGQAIDQWAGLGYPGYGKAVIGTPEDAIAQIEALLEKSGGFGTYLINAHDVASFEDTKRSFELFASEVIPHFQGSNDLRLASDAFMVEHQAALTSGLHAAVTKATEDYYGPSAEVKTMVGGEADSITTNP